MNSSEKKTQGSCACGEVFVDLSKDDVEAGVHCFCTNCQRLTGGGKSSNLLLDLEKVSIEGPIEEHPLEGSSGRPWKHCCCRECGASIAMINLMEAKCVLRAGILKDTPEIQFISIFTRSARPWDLPDTEIQFEGAVPQSGG